MYPGDPDFPLGAFALIFLATIAIMVLLSQVVFHFLFKEKGNANQPCRLEDLDMDDEKKEPKSIITFRTSEKERLEALAKQEGRTVSYLVNRAVKEFLDRHRSNLV